MDLRFTKLKGLDETVHESLPTTSIRPSLDPKKSVTLQQRLWTCSEVSVAVLCFILLSLFGFLRALDSSLSFVQVGVASRMNTAAPFVYAAVFLISGLHYAFLTLPRASATLRHVEVSSMAIALAYMTTLLIVDAASQPTPERALIPGFRNAAWLDAPVAAVVFIVVMSLSRSFTPSALTSSYEHREPLLIEQRQDRQEAREDMALLEWHASLDSGVLTNAEAAKPSLELRFKTEPLLRLACASGLVSDLVAAEPSQMPTSTAPTSKASLSLPPTLALPLLSNESSNPAELYVKGMDARSSHLHFDSAWDWVRQCLLGVLIVSWVNQLALLTDGLRVRTDRLPPDVALTQSMSSIALLFSSYFQFVHCPKPVYLMGPILWRLITFLGVVLTIVASDVMLLPWQATL